MIKTNEKHEERLKATIENLGCTIGIMNDNDIKLTKKATDTIIENLDEEYTDLFFIMRQNLFVAEICTVDNEKDVNILNAYDYFNQYHDIEKLYGILEDGTITQKMFDKIYYQIF